MDRETDNELAYRVQYVLELCLLWWYCIAFGVGRHRRELRIIP
jgi:hypothetical protein